MQWAVRYFVYILPRNYLGTTEELPRNYLVLTYLADMYHLSSFPMYSAKNQYSPNRMYRRHFSLEIEGLEVVL